MMRVVGTAGHVDHGKSTLVQALTGIDPDRLKEEKARGMTIDLGFAWVDLRLDAEESTPPATVPVGIVDVPGHIDFIKNMLAGVGGIDAAILVIAADEGVMPQTREHLAILDLLAAPACVVALTKIDVVDEPEWLDLVELDVEALLEETRFGGAGAPIVRVSAQTGAGMEDLRAALARVLTELAPRRNRNRPRLPIDRVFTLSGFGAVVTGTLLDGELATGQEVNIFPAQRPARIRGMQTHNQPVAQALPGSRVALNLAGVAASDIQRGDVVAWPATLEPTSLLDVAFRVLPGVKKPLRHNQTFDIFCGASERRATVRLLGVETLEPGAEGWLQLRLDRPLIAVAGDRFILRRPSPSATIGGGTILHTAPRRRWKRFDPAVIRHFEQLQRGAPDELLLAGAQSAPFSTGADLIERASLDVATGEDALADLRSQGALLPLSVGSETYYVTLETEGHLRRVIDQKLGTFHAQWPLRRGLPQGEVRARLAEAAGRPVNARISSALLELWQTAGELRVEESVVAQIDHIPTPTPVQAQKIQAVLTEFAARASAPPAESETLSLLDGDEELLVHLLDTQQLLRLNQGVLMTHGGFEAATQAIVALATARGSITLADVRDQLETSRRYAQALLEELDARRITRRDGDVRILRAPGTEQDDPAPSDSALSDPATVVADSNSPAEAIPDASSASEATG
ncbi:MAG: selenocysteine-specific translation elongation factor [Litorilinea sp.]